MIKIDVSNAVPKRLGTYLLGIIPGLLFELSLAFGDPRLAHSMIDRAKQIYPFQPYALLILFAGSCLVVGEAFFLLSWFADLLIGSVYGFNRYVIRATFGSDWLYRAFGRAARNAAQAWHLHQIPVADRFFGKEEKISIRDTTGFELSAIGGNAVAHPAVWDYSNEGSFGIG